MLCRYGRSQARAGIPEQVRSVNPVLFSRRNPPGCLAVYSGRVPAGAMPVCVIGLRRRDKGKIFFTGQFSQAGEEHGHKGAEAFTP